MNGSSYTYAYISKSVALETETSPPLVTNAVIGHNPDPFPSTLHTHNPFPDSYLYNALISFSVYQVDVF
jgi:hypothetical protein